LIYAQRLYPKAPTKWEARFLVMKDYADAQTDAVGNCNKQLEKLRQLYDKKQSALENHHDTGGGTD
jgi:hypothetical protein